MFCSCSLFSVAHVVILYTIYRGLLNIKKSFMQKDLIIIVYKMPVLFSLGTLQTQWFKVHTRGGTLAGSHQQRPSSGPARRYIGMFTSH